jgi:hypothetical protein
MPHLSMQAVPSVHGAFAGVSQQLHVLLFAGFIIFSQSPIADAMSLGSEETACSADETTAARGDAKGVSASDKVIKTASMGRRWRSSVFLSQPA